MPDLLCYCQNKEVLAEVESLAAQYEIRIKSTIDFSTALEWAKIKPFDCALIDQFVFESERTKLSGLIWQLEPAAPIYVYDPNGTLKERSAELVIEGLLPLSSGNARERLARIFDTARKAGTKAREPFRVLVVEDLDSPRDIICSYIESFNLGSADGAASAQEALSMLLEVENKYSCVLTDIRMPKVSGKELIEQIRRHPKLQSIPVVVLTAYGTSDMLVECLKAGATGFLVKPPRKEDLRRELSRAMRIVRNNESPRLTGQEEAELLRKILMDRGF